MKRNTSQINTSKNAAKAMHLTVHALSFYSFIDRSMWMLHFADYCHIWRD